MDTRKSKGEGHLLSLQSESEQLCQLLQQMREQPKDRANPDGVGELAPPPPRLTIAFH